MLYELCSYLSYSQLALSADLSVLSLNASTVKSHTVVVPQSVFHVQTAALFFVRSLSVLNKVPVGAYKVRR